MCIISSANPVVSIGTVWSKRTAWRGYAFTRAFGMCYAAYTRAEGCACRVDNIPVIAAEAVSFAPRTPRPLFAAVAVAAATCEALGAGPLDFGGAEVSPKKE